MRVQRGDGGGIAPERWGWWRAGGGCDQRQLNGSHHGIDF
jgi:hypothetical protein